MTSLWMPGAKVMMADLDGGAMLGGPVKVIWHTAEADYTTKATSVASYLNDVDNSVHLVWNPVTGETVQCIPADRAGRGLQNLSGGVQTNRGGKYVIQIEVVGRAKNPFTDTACVGLDAIMDWLRSLGVVDKWPAGSPGGPEMFGPNLQRTVPNWNNGGHFTHSQVPENHHWDAGSINPVKILAAGTKVTPPPVKPGQYAVIKGDTLWGLSQRWKVTVDVIKSVNKLTSDDLEIGKILTVPKPVVKPQVSLANLRPGKKNDDVRAVQKALNTKNNANLTADGIFGPKTVAAYAKWQAKCGYPNSSGVPGQQTLAKLGFKVNK